MFELPNFARKGYVVFFVLNGVVNGIDDNDPIDQGSPDGSVYRDGWYFFLEGPNDDPKANGPHDDFRAACIHAEEIIETATFTEHARITVQNLVKRAHSIGLNSAQTHDILTKLPIEY